ncbi:hypothetical protein Calkr_2637 (plasmid) [Caldicellulosiruptor acetigenus I77R1B]|uniref:Uncharacterized protein n=1 Tax=Caldicellulosiruptor acetigenus (strain ATCC 700853 / DSM 12137 / I77R1B) TaxID=632335 RepID=E4SAY1_CALA7|nr:hypothetical protein [Caldicellulosiruptor acetigenus]ADQ42060.1 hypothetical protein Calkr_2637 [Caldicellulosiruptor acetigenus I77R1B]
MPTKLRIITAVILVYVLTLYLFGMFGDIVQNISKMEPYQSFMQGKSIKIRLMIRQLKSYFFLLCINVVSMSFNRLKRLILFDFQQCTKKTLLSSIILINESG